MKYLRLLLYPFSLVYGTIIWCRNRLYDAGYLKQTSFDLPVIVVGNLEIGGTGKSPMSEYLIRLFKDRYRLATLSRGYGRKTKGFVEVSEGMTAKEVGDEPLQFKHKFPEITVAVQEDRVAGVHTLAKNHEMVILDDAYQHRALKPGFSILLFDYNRINDFRVLLPAGNFRDHFSERRRADIMVVTKCPDDLTAADREQIVQKLKVPQRSTPIYFAGISYGEPLAYDPINQPPLRLEAIQQALIVTGIARPAPLLAHLRTRIPRIGTLTFPDHHPFSKGDIHQIGQLYEAMKAAEKVILTTEKDIMRLQAAEFAAQLKKWPIYYIPIKMKFLGQDGENFEKQLIDYRQQVAQY